MIHFWEKDREERVNFEGSLKARNVHCRPTIIFASYRRLPNFLKTEHFFAHILPTVCYSNFYVCFLKYFYLITSNYHTTKLDVMQKELTEYHKLMDEIYISLALAMFILNYTYILD